MIIDSFIQKAQKGEPVYISEVDSELAKLNNKVEVYIILDLLNDGEQTDFLLSIPAGYEDNEFIRNYFYAKIYNILSTLGGRKMSLYFDSKNKLLVELTGSLDALFGINETRKERKKYARAINVIDRMLENLCGLKFSFDFYDISAKPENINKPQQKAPELSYLETVESVEGFMCGIDVGGTDIKMAISHDDNIICYKEYDWFPAGFSLMQMLIDPIVTLVKLMRLKVTYEFKGKENEYGQYLEKAFTNDASLELIEKCVVEGERIYGEDIQLFDGIGMCFPDIVISNKVVGGEVLKERGVRENEEVDYEAEFKKLSNLNDYLQPHCKPDGVVKMTNDGPMASYTAAVEMAMERGEDAVKEGIFAHTLGTELGTGWVDERGEIPEIPLEAYNYVVDLGSYDQIEYEPDDLRSINNFSTFISGTVQKYASQSGVFRLAVKYFKLYREDLYYELVDKGFVEERDKGLYVPIEPVDLRKPFLEHVMSLPERENCPVCERIFREIGHHLAVTWQETENILNPVVKERYLFGRLVKNKRCFELMQEGAKEIISELQFIAADENMANSPFMKQLSQSKEYTVAQFAQAVGALYFAMSDRI